MKTLNPSHQVPTHYPSRNRERCLPSPPTSLYDCQLSDDPTTPDNYTIDHSANSPSPPPPPPLSETHTCHQCGKTYKLASCLGKHLWEHSEGWALTKTLPLSKHQQVQILEAASILLTMSTRTLDSDNLDIIRIVDEDYLPHT